METQPASLKWRLGSPVSRGDSSKVLRVIFAAIRRIILEPSSIQVEWIVKDDMV